MVENGSRKETELHVVRATAVGTTDGLTVTRRELSNIGAVGIVQMENRLTRGEKKSKSSNKKWKKNAV